MSVYVLSTFRETLFPFSVEERVRVGKPVAVGGRHRSIVDNLLRSVLFGWGGVYFLVGLRGCGRTTVLFSLKDRLEVRGYKVLYFRCGRYGFETFISELCRSVGVEPSGDVVGCFKSLLTGLYGEWVGVFIDNFENVVLSECEARSDTASVASLMHRLASAACEIVRSLRRSGRKLLVVFSLEEGVWKRLVSAYPELERVCPSVKVPPLESVKDVVDVLKAVREAAGIVVVPSIDTLPFDSMEALKEFFEYLRSVYGTVTVRDLYRELYALLGYVLDIREAIVTLDIVKRYIRERGVRVVEFVRKELGSDVVDKFARELRERPKEILRRLFEAYSAISQYCRDVVASRIGDFEIYTIESKAFDFVVVVRCRRGREFRIGVKVVKVCNRRLVKIAEAVEKCGEEVDAVLIAYVEEAKTCVAALNELRLRLSRKFPNVRVEPLNLELLGKSTLDYAVLAYTLELGKMLLNKTVLCEDVTDLVKDVLKSSKALDVLDNLLKVLTSSCDLCRR